MYTVFVPAFASVKDEKGNIHVKDENGTVMAVIPAAIAPRPVVPPTPATASTTGEGRRKRESPAVRAGFLLGDGAGMGKGRTLAGFVVENIARGRKKHVWISVSSDLYEGKFEDVVTLLIAAASLLIGAVFFLYILLLPFLRI